MFIPLMIAMQGLLNVLIKLKPGNELLIMFLIWSKIAGSYNFGDITPRAQIFFGCLQQPCAVWHELHMNCTCKPRCFDSSEGVIIIP